MAGRKQPIEHYEEEAEVSRAPRVIACGMFYAIAVLLLVSMFLPEPSPLSGVKHVLCGLGGVLAFLIPLFLAWIATLLLASLRGKKVSPVKSTLFALIFPLLHTLLHLFFVPQIIDRFMTLHTFMNHLKQSFDHEVGGGAIGAILAWPLSQKLGVAGGVIAVVVLIALALLASGKLRSWIGALRGRRQEEELPFDYEHQFDEYDEPAPQPKRSARAMRTETPIRGVEVIEEEPKKKRSRKKAQEEIPPEPQVLRHSADGDSMHSLRGENLDPQPPRRRSEPAQSARPRRKMYTETIEGPNASRRAVDRGDEPRPSRRRAEEEPLRTANETRAPRVRLEDDSPRSARMSREEEPPRRARITDEPHPAPKSREPARRQQEELDDPDLLFEVANDDLTIEPDYADVLEGDMPPELPKTPKKPLGKLKRPVKEPSADEETYNYPPIDLLAEGEKIDENYRDGDMEKAQLLETTLKEFGINTRLTGIAHGPAVTRFEVQPAAGIKVSRITALADDIAMHLAAMSVRIEAPIPGKSAVGVEIPNSKVETVRLRDVLESAEACKSASKLAVGLGKDNSGRYIVADIAKMPHVLIAGQTGSGKSVCINAIITSILFRATPDEVKLILIDPKVVELSIYNDIPHLVCPVVTDCKKAASALQWAVAEMERRYKVFAENGVRDIKGYNKELPEGEKAMPQMVIIIDELADLMMVAQGDVEDSICRLAQLARAAGMLLVIATQRPSVNVITGTIKANIPTRIAFSVASQIDSRTMIDHGGAEKLLGNGDMLFVPSGINKPMRVQGAWVSDEEVHAITTYIKSNSETDYDQDMIERMEKATLSDAEKEDYNNEYDDRLPEAVEIVVEAGQASVSMLQRRMRVGYARAGRLIDEMEQRGIVSEADGAKPRSVLITREQMNELFE